MRIKDRLIATVTFLFAGQLNPVFAQENTTESVNNEQLQLIGQVMNTSDSNSLFNPQPPIELIRGMNFHS